MRLWLVDKLENNEVDILRYAFICITGTLKKEKLQQ